MITQSRQTIGHHLDGSLRLTGLPYFHTPIMRRIGTVRNTHYFLNMIKAFYCGYAAAGNTINVAVFLKDDLDIDTGNIQVPLTITTSDTNDTIRAAVPAIVSDYCLTNYNFTPDAGEWLVSASTTPRSEATLALSVQTSTGAVGTQVSATRDALVFVSQNISVTASIPGSAANDLVVEIAPTNSATAGDWIEKARSGQSQALSLALVLQSVQVVKGVLTVYVPAGYYLKVRSLGSIGTFSNGVSNSRVVLL